MTEKDPKILSLDEIEEIEKLTLRWIFQAVYDFGMEAHEVFFRSPDSVKDIAEDITRELLDRLSGFNVQQRVYGTVDYKKARYVILPDQTVRQALFIDSKAEKENRSATIQMSQTSMWVRQRRSGDQVNEKGFLPEISRYEDKNYLTTTCLIHFRYDDDHLGRHHLREVTIAAIPNGKLQEKYNPTVDDGIWLAGRNAPTLGEDFRVRVGFSRLKAKASWRVQTLTY
ncbi:MAG: SfiI family type II restriction endonuclease [Gemmatimonadetes bacterium]|nr:SfiI family type II restriction endonuclease [Gemmatimonadota bacterium]